MILLIWLLVWLYKGHPSLYTNYPYISVWGISLLLVIVIEILNWDKGYDKNTKN